MPTIVLSRRTQVAIETEATSGTAETLVAADVGHRVENATFSYGFDVEENELMQDDLSANPDLIGNLPCELSYDFKIQGEGNAGTAPGWASILVHGGFDEVVVGATSVAYSPETPCTTNSATIGIWRGAAKGASGRLFIMKGARPSSISWTFDSGKAIGGSVTWKGAFSSDADAAAFAGVTYDTTSFLKAKTLSLSIGAWTPFLKTLTINVDIMLGQVDDIGASADISGISHYEYAGRKVTGDLSAYEVLRADKNILADTIAETEAAMSLTAGATAGNICAWTMPKVQLLVPSESTGDDLMGRTIPFKANRNAGNDELVVTLT